MHILCPICSDLVNHTDNIYVTKCGHVFHFTCLSQWIVRSKSCPQCRFKVTDKCMFRLYPNISNDNTGVDATTLQSRLDDALLQLRQQKAEAKEKDDKLATVTDNLRRNEELLKASEKKLVSRESAVLALKEQLEYVKVQNKEMLKLKEENESLKKNLQTLNGLQKVLNATSDEVENMLEGYTDMRTIATFAIALKKALCESESKKNEVRDRQQSLKQQMMHERNELQARVQELMAELTHAQATLSALRRKRKAEAGLDHSLTEDSWESAVKQMRPSRDRDTDDSLFEDSRGSNTSFNTMVKKIENADSPYLNLKQSSLALAVLERYPLHPLSDSNLKPSELALVNSARNTAGKPEPNLPRTSIFHKKQPPKVDLSKEQDTSPMDVSYDGLGGHSKLDEFPKPCPRPKGCVPKLTAKHRLRRPPPSGSQDISKMLGRIQNK